MEKTITASIIFDIPEDKVNDIRSNLDHHIEYLIDMDTNRDRINAIYGVESYEPNNPDHTPIKLKILKRTIQDILSTNRKTIPWDLYAKLTEINEMLK